MKIKSIDIEEYIPAMLEGAVFLGTGGGGSKRIMQDCSSQPIEPSLLTNIDNNILLKNKDKYAAVIGFAGSSNFDAYRKTPYIKLLKHTLKQLENIAGVKINYLLPCDAGIVNLFTPYVIASEDDIEGVSVIDGDGSGRAFPDFKMAVFPNNKISPFCIGKFFGGFRRMGTISSFTESNIDDFINIIQSGSSIKAFACWVMKVEELINNKGFIPGTISKAVKIGKIIRENRTKTDNVLSNINNTISDSHARFLLKNGTVKDFVIDNDSYYFRGHIIFEGLDTDNKKVELTIYFKNENILAEFRKLNEQKSKIVAMAPDLICYLRSDGYPITNAATDIQEVRYEKFQVGIIVMKAEEKVRSNKDILSVYEETYKEFIRKESYKVVYKGKYKPFEQLINNS